MKKINRSFPQNILNGIKVPHCISQPVITFEDGRYYLTFFVFFYTKTAMEKGEVDRPSLWLIADIETLEILKEYPTTEKEFSDAPYNMKYSIQSDGKYDASKNYYAKTYQLLDSVREKIIKEGKPDIEEYQRYLDRIMANTPKEYCRFYRDLSI